MTESDPNQLLKKLISTEEGVEILRAGGCVGMPTETVYGLAADISQPIAIDQIFEIKNRPFFDPLIVHLCELEQVNEVAEEFPDLPQKLARKFWPGPLTIVLPRKNHINPKITSGLDTIGMRMPNHQIALDLIKGVGHPLAAPSANMFGKTSPTSALHVLQEFNGKIPAIDGGPCSVGLESTVIGFDQSYEKIFIYRPGCITAEDLGNFAPVEYKASESAPGQIKHHYMPNIPLVVLTRNNVLDEQIYEFIQAEVHTQLKGEPLRPNFMNLPATPAMAARELYSELRKSAQEKSYANCLILFFPHWNSPNDLWQALVNRLERAATLIV